MTDPLIDQLVSDLKPCAPLRNERLWMHCLFCLAVIAAIILTAMGIRSDYLAAMQSGAFFWKPGLFLLGWVGSIALIADVSRPVGTVKRIHLLPLVCAGAVLIWQFFVQMTEIPLNVLTSSLVDRAAVYCLLVVLLGGSVTMVMVWRFWLSKTASSQPALLGFLTGLSAGLISATAYALHCNRDTVLYVSAYYGLPILALSVLGAVLGRKYLRW